MHSFRPDHPRKPPVPAQGCTALCHCFKLKSGGVSKAAKRLGDFLQREWGLRLFQSRGARVHHPFFYSPPKSFPEGPFVTMPVLGCPSLEGRHWSTNHLPRAKQVEVKWGKGSTPTRKISFVSLVAYGPKVSLLSLAMGGYSFWNQAGGFQQHMYIFKYMSIFKYVI